MRYLKPLRPFFAWSQLSIPTVYDDSLSYYEVLNKCIFHFNEMLKIMQENYEIIDEAFAKILEECEAAIARCEEAAARAEAAQSAAEKAQAAAEAAQAAAEAAQKLAEAAQAAAEAARDDAVTAQKAAEAAQAAAEAAQAAAEAAQQKAETAQAAAEAAQAKAEDAQEKAESARDAAQAAQNAAEAAQQKAEEAQNAAESARDAAQAAQTAAESARDAAQAAQSAAESARDEAQAAQTAAEAAQKKAETAQEAAEASEQAAANSASSAAESASNAAKSASSAAESASNAAESASSAETDATSAAASANQAAESATNAAESADAAHNSETSAADSAADAAASAEEIKNALDNYYDKTESDDTFVKKAGDTMTGNLVMDTKDNPNNGTVYLDGAATRFRTIFLTGNQDFNNLILNGIYCRSGTTSGDKNYPSTLDGSNFVLIVIAGASSKIVKQIFFNYGPTPDIYIRFSSLSQDEIQFGSWEKIAILSDISGNYLPLSGGTMTGNITMSADTKLIGNAETSDFFKLIRIPANSDMNKIIDTGFYAIAPRNNVSNVPEGISGGNNAFSCFVFPWWYPSTTGIAQLAFGGQEKTVKGVYFRLTNNPDTGWSDWVRLDNTAPENTVKIYGIKETDHLRFIIYDLGNYYKVEGYTKQELKWNIPKTIESSPVVGNTYIYNTSLDEELTTGIGEQYTMTSDAHITVCPGLEYFRSSGIVSSISLGGKLGILCLDDSFGKFSFEIQIVWPDDGTWSKMSNKYDIILRENSSVGIVIFPK